MSWGGTRQGAGRKLDPDTIEWRKWCRKQLRSKAVRRRITANLLSKDPTIQARALHEIIATAHPVPTELSGVIEIGGGIRVIVNASKFGVQV